MIVNTMIGKAGGGDVTVQATGVELSTTVENQHWIFIQFPSYPSKSAKIKNITLGGLSFTASGYVLDEAAFKLTRADSGVWSARCTMWNMDDGMIGSVRSSTITIYSRGVRVPVSTEITAVELTDAISVNMTYEP